MVKKRVIVFCLVAIFCILEFILLLNISNEEASVAYAYAYDYTIPIPQMRKDVYIYDKNKIIDEDTEKLLSPMLIDLAEKTKIQFVIVSVDSLLGNSIEYYANYLFKILDFNEDNRDNCILFLFSPNDEEAILKIGQGLESFLTSSKCSRILEEYFFKYSKDNEYSKATLLTVKEVLSLIAQEYGISIDGLKNDLENDVETTNTDGGINDFLSWAFDNCVAILIIVIVLGLLVIFLLSITNND